MTETEYQDERPDSPIGEETDVWVGGGESVEGEQFIEALDAVIDLQEALDEVRSEIAEIDTGLDREDTIRLIKGRNMGMALDDIESFFDAVDTIIESPPEEVAPRLIQSRVADLTIEEAAEFFDELVQLAEKYGSLDGQAEDDQQ